MESGLGSGEKRATATAIRAHGLAENSPMIPCARFTRIHLMPVLTGLAEMPCLVMLRVVMP
jgi:hypothetical protein